MPEWKILIGEDDPVSFRLLSWILKKLLPQEYQLLWAQDGQDLVDQALAHHPDVIITDIRMPRLDGLSALERIATALPPHCPVPQVVIASAIESSELDKIRDHFPQLILLPKPIDVEQFTHTLQQLLQ